MRVFIIGLGYITLVFAVTSKFVGDVLKDVLNWLY